MEILTLHNNSYNHVFFFFFIAVSDFITAPNFGIVINKLRFSGKPKVCNNNDKWLSEKYTMHILEPKHKDDVIK